MKNVLVIGVALTDKPTLVGDIEQNFRESTGYEVVQAWVRMEQPYIPKFVLLNQVLQQFEEHLRAFDYVVVSDDDIKIEADFLTRYLGFVEQFDFALAQPARTPRSHIHHPIVQQVSGVRARETKFVEIGPLFSVRQDVLPLLTPFDEASPMGWGYDYVWPVLIEQNGLRMGIVDATPVEHRLRDCATGYAGAGEQMAAYLSTHAHLSPDAAYREVQRHV